MKLSYLGHSSFAFTARDGTKIVTDPYGDVGFSMPRISADAVTLSHLHYDHCNTAAVSSNVILKEAGEFTVGGFSVRSVSSFHDGAAGAKRGKNLIFTFAADGISVCHLGDLGEPFSLPRVKTIGNPDVLLLPVGGNYTIDAAEAKKYVDAIAPSLVIPMHYFVRGLTVDIEGPERFLSLFPRARVESAGSEIALDPAQRGETKIILMERAK